MQTRTSCSFVRSWKNRIENRISVKQQRDSIYLPNSRTEYRYETGCKIPVGIASTKYEVTLKEKRLRSRRLQFVVLLATGVYG
mmetsp:Transcript_15002/g.41757  ORF Transcript_15002/g.41757 Transcript_15002/m.41757 type:complete len:83 (+) Transcript_15002:4404-4652(+)